MLCPAAVSARTSRNGSPPDNPAFVGAVSNANPAQTCRPKQNGDLEIAANYKRARQAGSMSAEVVPTLILPVFDWERRLPSRRRRRSHLRSSAFLSCHLKANSLTRGMKSVFRAGCVFFLLGVHYLGATTFLVTAT